MTSPINIPDYVPYNDEDDDTDGLSCLNSFELYTLENVYMLRDGEVKRVIKLTGHSSGTVVIRHDDGEFSGLREGDVQIPCDNDEAGEPEPVKPVIRRKITL